MYNFWSVRNQIKPATCKNYNSCGKQGALSLNTKRFCWKKRATTWTRITALLFLTVKRCVTWHIYFRSRWERQVSLKKKNVRWWESIYDDCIQKRACCSRFRMELKENQNAKAKVVLPGNTTALRMGYTWYISLPSSSKQRHDMHKFWVVRKRWTTTDNF